jgi:hypothetical protein
VAKSPTKDPRFRPFRGAAVGIYLVVVCGFSLLVVKSVWDSVHAMSPGVPAQRGEALDVPTCLTRAQALFDELDDRRRQFSRSKDGEALQLEWEQFRVEWVGRLRVVQGKCAVESPERRKLAKVFSALERVEDLYTTSAMQYGGEIAPAVAKFRAALADER